MSRTKGRGKGGWRGRRGGGRGGQSSGGRDRTEDNRVSFDKLPKTNARFENYYNDLNIIPVEEREAFWTTLRTELPTSFRFTGSKGDALALKETFLERYSPKLQQADYAGQKVTPPEPLDWYPNQLAYMMNVPKNIVRKVEQFKEFQKFQVLETAVGNMNRQEVVSMIPPLFLDVQPEHTVLDMCAAPGSKTAQIIEMLHQNEEDNIQAAIANATADGNHNTGQSTGMLIANDSNYKRAQMLVHQTKRLNSPNLIVTCHDATMFPSIALVPGDGQRKGKYVYFDRVLADVPCSGDGTLRKNPNIWADWSPQNSLGLYITQVRILVRGLQLLKRGGRIVYSTCSMNPVEDEAVVASAIERCGGIDHVRIVDCSDMLPTLKRRPGLTSWNVITRENNIYNSWEEAGFNEQSYENSRIVPGMFGPDPEEEIPLERCMRFYPHDQNTGGFFVAVLERCNDSWTAVPEKESKCMNKGWVFKKKKKESPPDENGQHDEEEPPVDSATAILNGVESSTLKRKADESPEEDYLMTKKIKQNDTNSNSAGSGGYDDLRDTVMSRVDDLPSTTDSQSQASTIQQVRGGERDRKKQPEKEYFKYLDADHPELQSIYKSYKLHRAFPRDCFLVRNNTGDPKKGIYFTSELVKKTLEANVSREVKFVNAGVKMFMKQDVQDQDACRWRIQIEGLPIIQGWVSEDKVVEMWRKDTLHKLLKEMFVKINVNNAADGQGWRSLPDIGERVRDLPVGCYILRFKATHTEEGYNHDMTFPLWKGVNSVNLMAPKEERKALLYRIFKDDSDLVNNNDPKRTDKGGSSQAENENAVDSVSDQADAKEVPERIQQDGTPDIDKNKNGGEEGEATTMEVDASAERDDLKKEKSKEA